MLRVTLADIPGPEKHLSRAAKFNHRRGCHGRAVEDMRITRNGNRERTLRLNRNGRWSFDGKGSLDKNKAG